MSKTDNSVVPQSTMEGHTRICGQDVSDIATEREEQAWSSKLALGSSRPR
jgi:hypothetical protein